MFDTSPPRCRRQREGSQSGASRSSYRSVNAVTEEGKAAYDNIPMAKNNTAKFGSHQHQRQGLSSFAAARPLVGTAPPLPETSVQARRARARALSRRSDTCRA